MNLKIKLFDSVEYQLKLLDTDNIYIGTSLDILDMRELPSSITKIPVSISNLDKILGNFNRAVPFVCAEEDRYLYEWVSNRLKSPIVPKISPFLDYIHPNDGDIFIKLERSTFCFELVKITTFVECSFEDARKTTMLCNKAQTLNKLASRHSAFSPQELSKLREGTFVNRRQHESR